MDRWSRRWQSGEVNKEHVRDILNEVSATQRLAKGSAEQLAGDFYAACMDEAASTPLGMQAGAAHARRVRRDQGPRRRAAQIAQLHAGHRAPVPVYGPRTCTTRPWWSRTSTPAASACPTATTT
jgi:predicted metalloendopeptidase